MSFHKCSCSGRSRKGVGRMEKAVHIFLYCGSGKAVKQRERCFIMTDLVSY